MKFTKEEKQAFVNRYQNGETVLQICNENQIPRKALSIAGYRTTKKL